MKQCCALLFALLKQRDMFKKRKWSKYKHVKFVEDFRAGIKTYEILRRVCELTGDVEYKRVYVKSCVHNLSGNLNVEWNKT